MATCGLLVLCDWLNDFGVLSAGILQLLACLVSRKTVCILLGNCT